MSIRKPTHITREDVLNYALGVSEMYDELFDAIAESDSADTAMKAWSDIRHVLRPPHNVPFFWACLQGVKRFGYTHEALEFAVGYDTLGGMWDNEIRDFVVTDAVQAGMDANPVYASVIAAKKYADEYCAKKFNRKGKPLNKQQFWHWDKVRGEELKRLESIRIRKSL